MATVLIRIVFFVVLSASPLVALLWGAVEPYGSEHPDFPEWQQVLHSEPGALDALGEAVLHRSLVTKGAIWIKNTIAAKVFHYIDTNDVVSGRDDWMFLKSELDGRSCFLERRLTPGLAHLDLMTDMAEAASVALIVSLSPDKSAVYPEKLHPLARPYWACKAENTALLSRLASAKAPRLVQHLDVLREGKALHPERQLYFRTDTHWTPYGAALALRQLLSAIWPGTAAKDVTPPAFTGQRAWYFGDIGNGLLLLSGEEAFDAIDEGTELKLARLSDDPTGVKTVVLRDSFYRNLVPTLSGIFPDMRLFHVEQENSASLAMVDADRVIINSVQRKFVSRISSGPLSRSGMLSSAIISRNRQTASRCESFVRHAVSGTASAPESVVDFVPSGEGWKAVGGDPQLVIPVPGTDSENLTCLRIDIEAPAEVAIEIFLPRRHRRGSVFEAGRSFSVDVGAGRQTVTLVLPGYVRGRPLRIDLGDTPAAHAELLSVQFGELRDLGR